MCRLFILFLSLSACIATAANKPNIVIILADDLGFSDIGSYGSEIQTPNLDKLANNGLRYTQFYNTARCWPTRGSLMTGYYAQQISRDAVFEIKKLNKRPSWAQLLPKVLKQVNYRSYHIGKWHIDGKPIKNGFDRSYELRDQHRFFNPQKHFEDDKPLAPVAKDTGFYGTVKVADKAIEYLADHQKNHAQKPFMAFIAFAAPHFPLHALPEDIAKVGNRYAKGWDSIREERWSRLQQLGIISGKLSPIEPDVKPPYDFPEDLKKLGSGEINYRPLWNSHAPEQKKFQQAKMSVHAAMIERMDTEIGRIVTQIKKMNAYEDTLILFLSDNGASAEIMIRGDGHDPKAVPGSAESHLCLGPGWSTTANTPFRRHKTWVHEGGACTPMIAHWPKGISTKGAFRKTVGHVIDIVPTILELTGAEYKPTVAYPGKSLVPTFTKDNQEKRTVWWAHEGNHAIRIGDWKLIKTKDAAWSLYNLAKDRTETNDLASSYPEKVKLLEKEWLKTIDGFREDLKQ
ncbi:MAG: arylsulfatase [Lentisphaeraceae bacterium]|nr:arylsulfatase [Lentisphaeraceae bacterium]